MDVKKQNIPRQIIKNIRQRFPANYKIKVRKLENKEGEVYFAVRIESDDFMYHLKFNNKGDQLPYKPDLSHLLEELDLNKENEYVSYDI